MNTLDDKEKQYNNFLNYSSKPQKSGIKIFFLNLFAMIIATVVVLSMYMVISGKSVKDIVKTAESFRLTDSQSELYKNGGFKFLKKSRNILILGVDVNQEGGDPFKGTRSDTIIILNAEPKSKSVNAVSIPRDSKVYVADNNGVQKINAAHAIGGVNLTVKTIEKTFGVHIDNYVVISTEGIKKLVDLIGGVPIYIEKDMHYHDYAGHLFVDLNKGFTVLDGKNAEAYIRFRHDAMGDIARTTRQQWFLRALLKKLQTPEMVVKIPDILNIAKTYVKTDLSLYEMSHLVALMRHIDSSKLEFATLPGSPSKHGYTSYWILEPSQTQVILDRMIYRINQKNTQPTNAGIIYNNQNTQLAMELKEFLTDAGYSVKCTNRTSIPHSQIVGHNEKVSTEFVKSLKKDLPQLKEVQFTYNPQDIYGNQTDFTIILADM